MTLVMIHGYPFDHSLWNDVRRLLPASLEVLAPDLPGFGGKPVPSQAPDLMVLAQSIADEMKKKHLECGLIVGISMGGYVALALAEKFPELVAGLVLIDTQSTADSEQTRTSRRQLIEKISREGIKPAVETALPKMFSSKNSSNPAFTQVVIQSAEKSGPAGLSWSLEAMARRPDRTAFLQTCEFPILFIHGTEDQFVPIDRAHDLAKSISQARWLEIPGAGHVTPIEAPAEVARALTDFALAVETVREVGDRNTEGPIANSR